MYDRQMIFDFLQQLLGELKLQQYELESKPLPPGIQKGVEKFCTKWGGSTLVTPLNEFDLVLAEFNGKSDQRREKLAATRKEQFDQTMRLIETLKTLGIFNVKNQAM